MDLERSSLEAFRRAFNAVARHRLAGEDLRPSLRPDVELAPAEVDLDLIHWLEYLGPHGVGNPGPLFVAPGVSLSGARTVGENHLKVRLGGASGGLDAIGFGLAERHPPEAVEARPHDVLFRLERNEWRGTATPQAKLADLRPSGRDA
jgi:single-stranded-DNA-specific exonuclease